MFSSESDQSSFQDNQLSFFTRAFAEAVREHEQDTIRYKHIVDFLSDHFQGQREQSPIFVIQGPNTEVFCSINEEIKKILGSINDVQDGRLAQNVAEIESGSEQQPDVTLKQLVIKDTENYATKDDVESILKGSREKVETFKYPNEFTDLYEIEHLFDSSTYDLPSRDVIGKWLAQHKEYFGEPLKEEKPYRVNRPIFVWGGPLQSIEKYRWEITDFKLTSNCSYDFVWVKAIPRYPNLPESVCVLALLFSKTSLRLFYFFDDYIEENWTHRELPVKTSWRAHNFRLKQPQEILDFIAKVQQDFSDWLVQRVNEEFRVEGSHQ